ASIVFLNCCGVAGYERAAAKSKKAIVLNSKFIATRKYCGTGSIPKQLIKV
ncbi:MAG: hypothetical protein ACI85U_003561, partial [Candidatus Promineifilaceae bacterium]